MVIGRPKEGDVFLVPTGDGRAGVGQVAARYGKDAYFLVVFNEVIAEEEVSSHLHKVLDGGVQFLALSLDAKFHAGHWPIISSAPVREDFPLPAYKEAVTSPDHWDVVDYSGLRRRRADKAELAQLPFRTIVAPVRLEKALRASIGIEPWLSVYDELRPHRILSRDLFG